MDMVQSLTIEQAIEQIQQLDQESTALKVEQLRRKFRIGEVVSMLDSPYGEKQKDLERISIATGVHVNQLREWSRIFDHIGGSMQHFNLWMEGVKKPAEYMLRELIAANSNPEVIGSERLASRMAHRFERLGEDIDTYSELVERNVVDREQAEGMFNLLHESLTKFREVSSFKTGQVVHPGYRALVRSMDCIITGQPGPSDPHHVMVGGVGMKGSDFSCIPLSREIHTEAENRGHAWLEETFGVRTGDLIAKTMHKILTGQDLMLPNDV